MGQRVNRNEAAAEEARRVWETGKPEKGRKKEIHRGGGTRKEPRKWEAAPGSDNLLSRLPLSPGSAGTPPGAAQAQLLSQEPRD